MELDTAKRFVLLSAAYGFAANRSICASLACLYPKAMAELRKLELVELVSSKYYLTEAGNTVYEQLRQEQARTTKPDCTQLEMFGDTNG